MNSVAEPLINDRYAGSPSERVLDRIIKKRDAGIPVVGMYCGYAPVELVRAAGAVPVFLCSFSRKTIPEAETVLPSNLCPLIKSSFGFIRTDSCPFYALSEAIIGETTCDGKKKMFELISHIKPTHVMDLPQMPDEAEAFVNWTAMVHKLKGFLEKTFQTAVTEDRVESEIRETNRKNRLMNGFFNYAAHSPPPLSWKDMYDVIAMELISESDELARLLDDIAIKIGRRLERTSCAHNGYAPRVLVSGCPVGGDAVKVFNVIEEAGGDVVAMEACSGMKGYSIEIEEDTGDPVSALARAYLKIPCSCMSPNNGRIEMLDAMISRFRPDAVIDVILMACHSYNVESYRVERHVQERHGLPFLKVETDFTDSDRAMIRTRVQALLENI
ncbi:MAG TPA: double-cubane-cluster-containing anaerobic reductase [Syntrophorhabdaceae bacterium]|nr:double-cubane-cluster-containing anaerobic reductase [Syntrophorhabdaceae bacterium]HQM82376.1 double-cubane-cluster-containing anaerobic reductase [Syntrophorhabdaceae bacterium]